MQVAAMSDSLREVLLNQIDYSAQGRNAVLIWETLSQTPIEIRIVHFAIVTVVLASLCK